MYDAHVLSEDVFRLIYGPNVYRYRGPDNFVRVCSYFKYYPLKPIIKSRAVERREHVRKGDIFVIINGEDQIYGKVTFVSRSDEDAGVFLFLTREFDRIDLSLFETARGLGSKVKWRVYL